MGEGMPVISSTMGGEGRRGGEKGQEATVDFEVLNKYV